MFLPGTIRGARNSKINERVPGSLGFHSLLAEIVIKENSATQYKTF